MSTAQQILLNHMKKYWIIVEGKPQGPFSASELRVRRDFTSTLPVWAESMADWTTVAEVEELAAMLAAEQVLEEAAAQESQQQPPPHPPRQAYTPEPPRQPLFGWTPTSGTFQRPSDVEHRPKNYIGLNIGVLICCCFIGGILGIVFGAQVNSKWERGDVEGAKRSSEIAAWCFIISFTLGLVTWPLQLVLSL